MQKTNTDLREFFIPHQGTFLETVDELAASSRRLAEIAREEVDLEGGVDPVAAEHFVLALAALQQAQAQFTLAQLHQTRALAAARGF